LKKLLFQIVQEMKLDLLFSLFKNNSESNSEDKLQTSFARRSSSAWSYSYDLHITKRWEEAMKMATKSEHSETDVEDSYRSELNLAEDLDDEFIFQTHPLIHDPTTIEHIISPASEVPTQKNHKNGEDYIPDSTKNLNPPGKVSIDGSLSDIPCLRLSHMQNQTSWLGRITRPFPKDSNDEIKPKKKDKQSTKYQIQTRLIENLLQFIQKTALPAIQKYEQLQRKYCNDKKEWTEKVAFLERQNSILKSELQNADRSSRDAKEELNNFMKFYRQNQLSAKGNFVCVPALHEIRKITELNLEALPMHDVKPCLSLKPECAGKKEAFIDFKRGDCKQVNNVEVERIATLNECQICYKDFPNMKEKLYQADKLNLEQKLQQGSLQGRNIFRKSKNKIALDWPEHLKDGNEHFESSCVNAQQEHHIEPTNREENYLFSKLDQLTPRKRTFVVAASRDQGGCGCERKPVQKGVIAPLTCVIEESEGTKLCCVGPDLRKMKEKTLPNSAFIDSQDLAVSDSCCLHKKDGAANNLNSISLKVDKERRFVNSQKICQVSTRQSLDSRNQCRLTNNRMVNKSISDSHIKSMWL